MVLRRRGCCISLFIDFITERFELGDQLWVLAAQDELLRQLDCTAVGPEALEMVAGGAGGALEDLDRVARDVAPVAVVQRAAESHLAAVVPVELHGVVLLQAVRVEELEARPNDALLHAIVSLIVGDHVFLRDALPPLLSLALLSILLLRLLVEGHLIFHLPELLADEALSEAFMAVPAHEVATFVVASLLPLRILSVKACPVPLDVVLLDQV